MWIEPAHIETLREMLELAERELRLYPANQPGAFHDHWERRRSALAAAIAQAEALQAAERETAGRFLDDFTAAQEGGICATRRWTVEAMREFLTQWEAHP